MDTQEREKIRAALEAYMDEHRIRVPKLRDAIKVATKVKISLSTLQRFMRRGERETNTKDEEFHEALRRFAANQESRLSALGYSLHRAFGTIGTPIPIAQEYECKFHHYASTIRIYPEPPFWRIHQKISYPRPALLEGVMVRELKGFFALMKNSIYSSLIEYRLSFHGETLLVNSCAPGQITSFAMLRTK